MRIISISEGQAIETLHTLGLTAPVAFEDLKKVYRERSKQLHPDALGGSEEKFKKLSNAFDELRQLYQAGSRLFDAELLVEKGGYRPPSMPRETVDGTPLSELGLGLGPTTNGRDCANCEHRGYTALKEHGQADCETCGGLGTRPCVSPCYACKGSGKFMQHKSQRVVDCRRCNGTGRIELPSREEWCRNCGGSGKIRGVAVTRIYVQKCWPCRGTGEIEVLNPVLPKGRLAFLNIGK